MLRATPESPKMFENEFIDLFSRIPWWIVPLVYLPLIALSFGQGLMLALPLGGMIGAFLAGVFVWTLTEYWLHRTLFHWTPATSWGPRMHFILHGVHHDWINDRYRLVMPPAASMGLAVVFFALWSLLLGAWVYPFFAGKMLGYLVYDMTHYYVHHGAVSGKIYKRLRAHHMNHHHNHPDRKFGVSNTLWDHVFGTY